MFISVIISTANRLQSLAAGLEALSRQSWPKDDFEVIVAENGPGGEAADYGAILPNCRFIHDERPGQLIGWHSALAQAKGEVGCFIDDDVRPRPGWLGSVAEGFSDPAVGLLGGPILGAYEADPTPWVVHMRLGEPGSETHPALGLMELGGEVMDLPANFVWGSNYNVRLDLLRGVGGFHPSAVPGHLLHFYGDGEIAPSKAIAEAGHRVIYHPGAAVDHWIPAWRMELPSLERKFYTAGVARSFQFLRQRREAYELPSKVEVTAIARRYLRDPSVVPDTLCRSIEKGLMAGIGDHLRHFSEDPAFRDWVLMEDYLDLDTCYTHPDLEPGRQTGGGGDWRAAID